MKYLEIIMETKKILGTDGMQIKTANEIAHRYFKNLKEQTDKDIDNLYARLEDVEDYINDREIEELTYIMATCYYESNTKISCNDIACFKSDYIGRAVETLENEYLNNENKELEDVLSFEEYCEKIYNKVCFYSIESIILERFENHGFCFPAEFYYFIEEGIDEVFNKNALIGDGHNHNHITLSDLEN